MNSTRWRQRRAAEAGYPNVDEYVAAVLQHDFLTQSEDFDDLFTEERLAHIDSAVAEIESGAKVTLEQADAELAERRDKWFRREAR